MTDSLDDEDWIELERSAAPGLEKPDAQVALGFFRGRRAQKQPRARATVWLRRDAAQWLHDHGPRFRVQVGGDAAQLIRIVPDAAHGQFECADFKGVQRLGIGRVAVWPNETRETTEARWRITPGGLLLTLPRDFAKPRGAAPPEPPPPPAKPEKTGPFPVTTRAPGLEASRDELIDAYAQKSRDVPREFGGVKVKRMEAETLEALLKRDQLTRASLLAATADPAKDDDRDEKMIDVVICGLRKKLAPLGVEIESVRGEGFRMSGASKARLRVLIEKARESA